MTSCVLKFGVEKRKNVDFLLMANFWWSILARPKNRPKIAPKTEPPDAIFEKIRFSDENLLMPLFLISIL